MPENIPEYIAVDFYALHIGDSIHLSEIALPEGVESTTLSHGGDDLAVVTVVAVRGSIADEEAVSAVAEAAAEASAESSEAEEGTEPGE